MKHSNGCAVFKGMRCDCERDKPFCIGPTITESVLHDTINELRTELETVKADRDRLFNQLADNLPILKERDALREALKNLYDSALADEKTLFAALMMIKREVQGRSWMADLEHGVCGISYDYFRSVEVNALIESITAIIGRVEVDSYPSYDDGMSKAKNALEATK